MIDDLDGGKAGEEVAGRYRVLVENANDGMIIVDPETSKITFANPALAKIFGYAITELERLSVFDLHFPEDHPKARAVFDRYVQGEVVAEQLPAKKKDGERIWVEIKPVLAQLDGREIALPIVRDITQSMELAEELRASEQKYRDLVENAFDIINSVDAEGNVVEANQRMTEVLDYSHTQITHMNVRDFVAPEYLEGILQHIKKTLAEGLQAGFVCDWITRDGRRLPVEINSTAGPGELSQILVTRCIIRDISERRRLEERLVREGKLNAVSEAAAQFGHSFNNLLTQISLRAGLIEMLPADLEEVTSHAKGILSVVEDAATIARRLQTLAQQSLVERVPLDINRLILDTVEMARPRWHAAQDTDRSPIDVVTQLDATAPIQGDPVTLREALLNLIYNSVDAMPQGGVITIKTEQQEGNILLSVSDSGTGMDEETKRHLFEPFFTTKAEGLGRGLGLVTAYRAIRHHDGEIEVDSVLGKGTTFRITLPSSDPNR